MTLGQTEVIAIAIAIYLAVIAAIVRGPELVWLVRVAVTNAIARRRRRLAFPRARVAR